MENLGYAFFGVVCMLGLGIADLIDKIHKLEKEIEGLQWRIESDNKKT